MLSPLPLCRSPRLCAAVCSFLPSSVIGFLFIIFFIFLLRFASYDFVVVVVSYCTQIVLVLRAALVGDESRLDERDTGFTALLPVPVPVSFVVVAVPTLLILLKIKSLHVTVHVAAAQQQA